MADYQVPPPGAAANNDPGKTLGTVGMILAIIPCTYLIGLILSIVGFMMSRRAGFANRNAMIGIIVGAVWLVISIIAQVTGFWTGLFTR